MYNTDMPTRAELPTSRQLLRSTAIAAASAVAILVAVVLPAEYGVDLTGIGSALNLTEMGEIKVQLAEEAAADAARMPRPGALRRVGLPPRRYRPAPRQPSLRRSRPRLRQRLRHRPHPSGSRASSGLSVGSSSLRHMPRRCARTR